MAGLPSVNRTGEFVWQPGQFAAFYPARLPFAPSVRYDDELRYILSKADQAIGRLDSAADMIPNPDIFVGIYVQKEAVLTSQLEGVTRASLSEFLEQEAAGDGKDTSSERAEVRNYVLASNYASNRLDSLPLGLELIKETHGEDFRESWHSRRKENELSAPAVSIPPVHRIDGADLKCHSE